MPKILSYTPSWMSRPSSGFDIFSSSKQQTSFGPQDGGHPRARSSDKEQEYLGPRRTIAHRGSEIFVVVDNHIRWADLSIVKYDWESLQRKGKRLEGDDTLTGQSYKLLKAPISEQIRQLSISPNGQLLAIATSHTVHIAILPDSTKFEESTQSPIKLQTHTVGPTTHVLSQSPIVSTLWHPLGVNGTCLVTVTTEAVVRLWELNRSNRWTFDSPTLAIDLTKLDAATSQEDDVSPSGMHSGRGFSADGVDMEIASACFGGTGSPDESAWSATTIWVTTTDGDVYALCPLLPSKWQPTSTQLPSLSSIAIAGATIASQDADFLGDDVPLNTDQYDFVSEIDAQDPLLAPRDDHVTGNDAIYNRPKRPGPIPKLQGPFQLAAGSLVDYLDVSDIHVIASKLDTEEMILGADDESEVDLQGETIGLSAAVVCLMTTDGRVHLFLDLEGVQGQWLPAKAPERPSSASASHEMILVEALDTLDAEAISENEWPTFSRDPFSRYSFYTTHSQGVYFFSLDPWIKRLEDELQNSTTAGANFRLNMLRESSGTLRECIVRFDQDRFTTNHISSSSSSASANACIVLHDSDLGYFLLTSTNNDTHPRAATLDIPKSFTFKQESLSYDDDFEYSNLYPDSNDSTADLGLTTHIARSAYEPPPTFWNQSSLLQLTSQSLPAHRRRTLREEVRLSTATLELMTSAHRLLSNETHAIKTAAADLFNRCERMMQELRTQIERVREVNGRAEQLVLGGGDDDTEGENASERLGSRAQKCLEKQERLTERIERLRRRAVKLEIREVGDKEREFYKELVSLEEVVCRPNEEDDDDDSFLDDAEGRGDGSKRAVKPHWQRYEELRHMAAELIERAKQVKGEGGGKKRAEDGYGISNDMRRKKVQQVMALLEREEALVDGVMMRLTRLSVGQM
ncbi:MAG: hypothetical protein L6R42_002447 [Xanthoria sp. 1 TBL-2021]|nr:MAG: hypothetical protein L6R42_002447 [Xanthoria sp. 1 TBL-2021]